MSASGAADSRCSDSAKCCTIDRTALHSEKDDDSSHTQENQAFLKAKKKNLYISMVKSVTWYE